MPIEGKPVERAVGAVVPRPAAAAAGRAFAVTFALGVLSVVSIAFVVARLLESWRVTTNPGSHVATIVGYRVSYPVANGDALVITVLAVLGLLMACAAVWGLARELLAARSFARTVRASSPRLRPGGDVWVIDDARPQAFCAGLVRPQVYISTGALSALDDAALDAVVAHERHHARRRDPLRLAGTRVLASALFLFPGLRRVVQRQQALAELGADEAAVVSAKGDRAALASAMLSFSELGGADTAGIDPERVDHLLGERASWRFPVGLCVLAAAALATFVALAVLLSHAAAGSATLAPPFVSSQPCIAVLALLPAGAALAAVACARARRLRLAAAPVRIVADS
jgi:Zn-dependent protease with chaperone function